MAARKLHIGGTCACEGWEILNIQPGAWVDHVGQADDLSRFADQTFTALYASHVLEHLDYQSSLPRALAEWHRVLTPGGTLHVSVPDLDILCQLFLDRDRLTSEERFHVMRMMFGGHIDAHDFHQTGLNEEILGTYLREAGFGGIQRVEGFGLFDDTSTFLFKDRLISLNLLAQKAGVCVETASHSPTIANALPAEKPKAASTKQRPVGASASWGQGYCTATTYGGYAFRELAPNWIDYALLGQRQRPPRQQEGSAFSYLELGSGMGVGLCLLAAAYPEGQFVGIDFHPSHIAHSQWLAEALQLANISFHEGDFLQLAQDENSFPGSPRQHFDYAVAHGILSWIAAPVREALFKLAASRLRPGGVFYCSYNCFPGWLERTAFKALADLERQRMGPDGLIAALERANHTLSSLLRTDGRSPAALARSFPGLLGQLRDIQNLNKIDYLSGEYGSENWQPFYVGQVHQLAAQHKLGFLASATMPENHPLLLPKHLSELITNESDGLIQQALLDLTIKQSFRRDLFVKGPIALSRTAHEQLLAHQSLRLTTLPARDPEAIRKASQIQTSMGTVGVNGAHFQTLEALLESEPASLADLHQDLGISVTELTQMISLLLHSGRLGLDRGAAGEASKVSCRAVNQRLMELMTTGHNLNYLAAPAIGHGAQPFSMLDAFVLSGIEQGLEGEVLASCVWMGMDAAGVEMRGADGELLSDPQHCLEQISKHIDTFRSTTLPRLVRLGIVDAQG
jgi:predicted SAM-dependent methyltransferase